MWDDEWAEVDATDIDAVRQQIEEENEAEFRAENVRMMNEMLNDVTTPQD